MTKFDWTNPSRRDVAAALRAGVRGLLTEIDLYAWQSHVLHPAFVAATGIHGLRINLRLNEVSVHDEAVAFPVHLPWMFPAQVEEMDIEDRRQMVVDQLKIHAQMRRVYPDDFTVRWYS